MRCHSILNQCRLSSFVSVSLFVMNRLIIQFTPIFLFVCLLIIPFNKYAKARIISSSVTNNPSFLTVEAVSIKKAFFDHQNIKMRKDSNKNKRSRSRCVAVFYSVIYCFSINLCKSKGTHIFGSVIYNPLRQCRCRFTC